MPRSTKRWAPGGHQCAVRTVDARVLEGAISFGSVSQGQEYLTATRAATAAKVTEDTPKHTTVWRLLPAWLAATMANSSPSAMVTRQARAAQTRDSFAYDMGSA